MSMIRFFVESQHGPQIGYMSSVFRTYTRTEDREVKRLKLEEYLRSKEEHWKGENDELAADEEITNMAAEGESNLEPLCSPKNTKLGTAPIVTSELSAALYQAQVSNRAATFILGETARSLEHEICSLNVNYESIRKARLKFRKPMAQSEEASFDPFAPLLVHWDGKMLPDIMWVFAPAFFPKFISSSLDSEICTIGLSNFSPLI